MITLYLIGLMSLIFVAHGFNVGTNLFNAVQYIGKIVLTSDGSNLSATGIVLDGNGWNAYFGWNIILDSLHSATVLGTNSSGQVIASTASNIANFMSWVYTSGYMYNSISWFLSNGTWYRTPIANWIYTGIQYPTWNIVTDWLKAKWVGAAAIGNNATAMGLYSQALGIWSTAMGNWTIANGDYSTTMGYETTGYWNYSLSAGIHSVAVWQSSVAMWEDVVASWDNSTAMWLSTHANWEASTAMGDNTIANGMYSTAMGINTTANWFASTNIGTYNVWRSGSIFEIWIGTFWNHLNAMTVSNTGVVSFPTYPNIVVLWTDASGTLIASSAANVYNYISGYITYVTSDKYTTWLIFNSWNNLLTLYVTGYGSVTGTITMSGAANWNNVYNRMLNSWNTLRNRYANTGIYVNSLWIATGLNCATGQLVKYNWSTRVCSGDLVGSGSGDSRWTGNGINGIYNTNTGFVGVGVTFPGANFQVSGTFIAGDPLTNSIVAGQIFSSIWGGQANIVNWSASTIAGGTYSTITWSLSIIWGGSGNTIQSLASAIMGGENNCIECQTKDAVFRRDFIWAGKWNSISQSVQSSLVGWSGNAIQGWNWPVGGRGGKSFIWGGEGNNLLTANYWVIWWGLSNVLSSVLNSSIVGGEYNTWDDANFGVIWGGQYNVLWHSNDSVIGGWSGNIISWTNSNYSVIPGGMGNQIEAAANSFAAWTDARALHSNTFVWNDGSLNPFSTTVTNSFIINASNGVGINTNVTTGAALTVSGTVMAIRFIATQSSAWAYVYSGTMNMNLPDYVFESYFDHNTIANPTYTFLPLEEVKSFVVANWHLPRVPSSDEIVKDGEINLQGFMMTILEKVEEAYLYIFSLNDKVTALQETVAQQQQAITTLQTEITALKNQ